MHFVIYLPKHFYASLAATVTEMLAIANTTGPKEHFSFEFVSATLPAISRLGIEFPARRTPSKKLNVLILLSAPHPDPEETVRLLCEEGARVKSLILSAQRQGATIAAACAAPFFLAMHGLLDHRQATIGWWLRGEVEQRFPQVKWATSRLVVRQGSIYTCGASFALIDLLSTLLIDLGFAVEERQVRKLMALPARRKVQIPFDLPDGKLTRPFEQEVLHAVPQDLSALTPAHLARELHLTERTLARRFADGIGTSPGLWIQTVKVQMARSLLEETHLPVSTVCVRSGYADQASFSRLFKRKTGLAPGEYRQSFMT